MTVADIAIAIVVILSIGTGFVRGLVKESLSLLALLVAVWAAFHMGENVGTLSKGWLDSPDMRIWFGRTAIFVVVLVLGILVSWAMGKLVRLSALSGIDRGLGMIFGFGRGAIVVAVAVLAGEYADFDRKDWWDDSALMPYAESMADWLRVMGPKGLDLLQPGLEADPPMDLRLPKISVRGF